MGRLPSQPPNFGGPNNGKYATLSKQCKTLESNDFYWESPACSIINAGSKKSVNDTENLQASDKDPRDVSGNGFNRFDPKYISIGPKALRNANSLQLQTSVNKCATLRHGGRYGGGLSSSSSTKGHSPNPNLKTAQPPSVAIVSKDYKNSYSNSSTIPYNKKSDLISISNSRNNLIDESKLSIYSIDTSHHRPTTQNTTNQNINKNQENCSIVVPPPPPPLQQLKGISILNQPLPEIPKSALKLPENNKNNSQQPLCATNLNQYRSLQRPTNQTQKSLQQQQQNPNQNIPKSTKIVVPTPKVLPPLLPPKNRHKEDSNRNRQQSYSTNTMPKNSSSYNSNSGQTNFNNNKNQSSTHTTFGYDRGQNMNNHQVNFQQTLEQLQQQHHSKTLKSISYNSTNDNNRSYSHSNSNKVNYQTLQHPTRSERAIERAAEKAERIERSERSEKPERHQASFNNSQHSQPQYHQKNYEKSSNMRRERRENGGGGGGGPGRGEADGGHHNNQVSNNKKDDPPIYYRSLQRGGTHANHDLYSVTEL